MSSNMLLIFIFAYFSTDSGLFPLIREINATARSILDEIEDWHRYRYDGQRNNEIRDGGMDAYDGGNRVRLKEISSLFPT